MNEIMKRLLLFTICLLCASSVYAIDISRLEPACWWVGMKNPELQIMVYDYMDYYNNFRCQWNLKKLTPIQFRNRECKLICALE